jgi:hypothetical protein
MVCPPLTSYSWETPTRVTLARNSFYATVMRRMTRSYTWRGMLDGPVAFALALPWNLVDNHALFILKHLHDGSLGEIRESCHLADLYGGESISADLGELELEARVRIELTHKGFADLSLTTWVPRLPGVPIQRGFR